MSSKNLLCRVMSLLSARSVCVSLARSKSTGSQQFKAALSGLLYLSMNCNHKAYCSAILRAHFGPVVEAVALALITRGRLRLDMFEQHLKKPIPMPQIKKSLIILMQHGIVRATTEQKRVPLTRSTSASAASGSRTVYMTQYELDVMQLHHRTRFPKYTLLMKERFGDEAEVICARLAEHGKLTLDSMRAAVIDHFTNSGQDKADETQQIGAAADAALQAMITAQFLIREDLVEEEENNDDEERVEESVGKRRGAPLAESTESVKKRKITFATSTEAANTEAAATSAAAPPVTLYTFNHAHFLNMSVRARVSEYVAARVNESHQNAVGAQMVALVELMLDTYIAKGWNIMKPKAISIGLILTLLPNTPLEGLSLIALTELLLELHHDSLTVPLLLQREMQAGPAGYLVSSVLRPDVTGIIDDTRLSHAKSVVKERFGSDAKRIFQILLDRKMLEEKQIQEMALLQKRAARECLHRMLVADFVRLQEIPKGSGGASDRVPARTCYLFCVPLEEVYLNLLDSYYIAWSNLKAHAAGLWEAVRPTFEKGVKFRNDADKVKIEQYQKAANHLELTMLRLDESIQLFRDL